MSKGHPKKSQCEVRADNRKAQAKFQDKNPGAAAKAVKKSEQSGGTKDKKTSGIGKNGGKLGRPRKDC